MSDPNLCQEIPEVNAVFIYIFLFFHRNSDFRRGKTVQLFSGSLKSPIDVEPSCGIYDQFNSFKLFDCHESFTIL